MKLLLSLIFLSLLLSSATTLVVAQGPPPPPPPAKDYSPNLWQEFSYPEVGFKIKFPGEPKRTTVKRENGGVKRVTDSISYGNASFINYDLTCTEYSQNFEASGNLKQFFDGYREGVLSLLLPKANYQILGEAEISVDGHPGRLIQVEVEKKKVLRMKTVTVGNRLYMLLVVTSIHSADSMGAENGYEKIAMSYLDSFQLIKTADKK